MGSCFSCSRRIAGEISHEHRIRWANEKKIHPPERLNFCIFGEKLKEVGILDGKNCPNYKGDEFMELLKGKADSAIKETIGSLIGGKNNG